MLNLRHRNKPSINLPAQPRQPPLGEYRPAGRGLRFLNNFKLNGGFGRFPPSVGLGASPIRIGFQRLGVMGGGRPGPWRRRAPGRPGAGEPLHGKHSWEISASGSACGSPPRPSPASGRGGRGARRVGKGALLAPCPPCGVAVGTPSGGAHSRDPKGFAHPTRSRGG
jgi:hypothetical protein